MALGALEDIEGKFLDVGCGEGLLLEDVLEQNSDLKIFGIDMDTEQIKRCRSKIGVPADEVNLLTGDAGELPFKDNFFDLVTAINIFYNLSEDKMTNIIKEINRVLKPGGILVADFRNKNNFFLRLRYLLAPVYDKSFRKQGKLLKAYSKKEMESIVKKTGFRLRDIYKTGRIITSARVTVLVKK